MFKQNKKNSIFSGVVWRFSERIAAQLVSSVVAIILARILMPEDYGLVAIVTILITIFNAFVAGGFGNSLIQKKDADEVDFSSMFFFSLFISLVFYLILFFMAEPIAALYKNINLVLIIRIMGIRLPFAAINSIQQAFLSKKMLFKKFFFATLIGTLLSAVVGITLAYKGFGPYALVFQYLINVIVDTIVLFAIGGWRPKLLFSWNRTRALLPFGLKVMGTNVLDAVFLELRSAIISINYSAVDLAMYDNGKKYPNLITTNVNTSIGSVIFPALSNVQDSKENIKSIMKKSVVISSYFLVPLLFGFSAIAYRFVDTVLTSKWIECVPFIYITSLMCVFYPIHTINIQALNAIGKSGLTLKMEVFKKIINILILAVTMFYGTVAIAIGALAVSLISTIINGAFSKKYFNYSVFSQLLDVSPILLLSFFMAAIVTVFDRFAPLNEWLVLLLDVVIGMTFYLSMSSFLKLKPFVFLSNKIKHLLKK